MSGRSCSACSRACRRRSIRCRAITTTGSRCAACAHLGLFGGDGPLCYVVDLGPLRLIGLDSLISGESSGRLGPEQLAWLDARLAEAPTTPALVALHHPPFRTGIDHMDAMMLLDGAALAEVIGRHPQVERVLCGHVHRMVQCRFAGTVGLITPGVVHAVQLTLTGEPGRWVMEPPGMLLHEWRDGRGLVSHLDFIGATTSAGSAIRTRWRRRLIRWRRDSCPRKKSQIA